MRTIYKMRSKLLNVSKYSKIFKSKFVIVFVFLATIYMISRKIWSASVKKTIVNLPYVVVHIDLKGSPPKLDYLESLLPLLKEYGVNGLLMEYEDMFPYEPNLFLAADNCYTREKLKHFLTKATYLGFEIIPLIQTFGHMEYVLKLEQYRHLREDPMSMESICPSHLGSAALIKIMVEQIINYHNNISTLKYLHIGCDEVYQINKCDLCREKNITNLEIFLNHLKFVTKLVKDVSPNTKILIWDDMLRGIQKDLPKMKTYDIEPVYWNYQPYPGISDLSLFKYHRSFGDIWIATAYKGADGRAAILPNITNRFLNHYNWLSLISKYKFGGESSVATFKGIILTGWSRYTHMDVPCELLAASIPSLIASLMVVDPYKNELIDQHISSEAFYKKYIARDLNEFLECKQIFFSRKVWCNTTSKELISFLNISATMNEKIDEAFQSADTGLFNLDFNIRKFYINRIVGKNAIKWCNDELDNLLDIENKLFNAMIQIYDENVVRDYLDYLLYNSKTKLKNAIKMLNNYLNITSWRQRYN